MSRVNHSCIRLCCLPFFSGWFVQQGEDGQPVYSKFNGVGFPTHDAAGEELSQVRPLEGVKIIGD